MNILFHHQVSDKLKETFRSLSNDEFRITFCEGYGQEFNSLLQETNVIWHVLTPLTADIISSAPALRLIQKIGVGVNTIDLEAAEAHSVKVCNMPGTNSRAVAEMVLLLIMATLRRLTMLHNACHKGKGWSLAPETFDSISEIHGKTIGLIGNGAIPKIITPILEAMGARVLYTDRSTSAKDNHGRRDLKQLVREADILSIHVPLTEQTYNMIGEEELFNMKKGSVLINTARGEVVDEAALFKALTSGHLSGAGLDVFAEEPLPKDNALLRLDNVVTTPHIAWRTQETMRRSFDVALENCRRLNSGEELLHRVV
ncbi:MAG: 2-hydroxyacid dehydrogenase [Gammaproteobacteria bacterium]